MPGRTHCLLGLLLLITCAMTAVSAAAADIPDFDNRGTIGNDDKLLVFIGRKIAITKFDPSEDDPKDLDEDIIIIHMDAAFKARYRILKIVHGAFSGNTIDFKAYDHYGFPAFAEHDVVMLYVSEHGGALYHEKYMYDRVYPTARGGYAGCGDPYLDVSDVHEIDPRPLERIEFDPPVIMRLSDYLVSESEAGHYSADEIREQGARVKAYFSAPVFSDEGDRATCLMGAYPDELFRIKKETVLRARRISDLCNEKLAKNPNPHASGALTKCIEEIKSSEHP